MRRLLLVLAFGVGVAGIAGLLVVLAFSRPVLLIPVAISAVWPLAEAAHHGYWRPRRRPPGGDWIDEGPG